MFMILTITSLIVLTSALQPIGNVELADDNVRDTINKYISKIPDIEEQYIVDERLTRAISHYFQGKMSSFPLYKISLKIDRNPIKIPWTLKEPEAETIKTKLRDGTQDDKPVQKRHKYKKIANKKTSGTMLPETTVPTVDTEENKEAKFTSPNQNDNSTTTVEDLTTVSSIATESTTINTTS